MNSKTYRVFFNEDTKRLIYLSKDCCYMQFLIDLIQDYEDSIFDCDGHEVKDGYILLHEQKQSIFKELFCIEIVDYSEYQKFQKEINQNTLKKILENNPEILL